MTGWETIELRDSDEQMSIETSIVEPSRQLYQSTT